MDRNQKIIIISSIIIFIALFTGVIVLFLNKDKITKRSEFIVPELEAFSIEGKPENVDETLTYQEIRVKENYIVSICATPKEKNEKLTLYFTSSEKNVDLLKVRIFDENNNLLGESGLLKPNSYVKDIILNRSLKENQGISVKVMSYEKDTYYSNGSFKLNLFVAKNLYESADYGYREL